MTYPCYEPIQDSPDDEEYVARCVLPRGHDGDHSARLTLAQRLAKATFDPGQLTKREFTTGPEHNETEHLAAWQARAARIATGQWLTDVLGQHMSPEMDPCDGDWPCTIAEALSEAVL